MSVNDQSPQFDAPIPAANLDPEKGSETPSQEKEEQVRQITGFKVSSEPHKAKTNGDTYRADIPA